jgi:glucose uptake protein GlcU
VAGLLSGSTFTAPQFIVDKTSDWEADASAAPPFPGASTALLDYLFSHFTGILFANVAYFALYAAARRNRPWVSSELALPSLLAGVCWGLAMVCWFVANAQLSIVIAYPIVTMGPGLLSAILGALLWGELKGWRSFWLVAISSALYLGASVLIVLSKPTS